MHNGFSQNLNMQDGTFSTCTGTFFDSGSGSSNYGTNENFSLTICPNMPDMKATLEFIEFELDNQNLDSLTIYDSDTADPTNLIGEFTGSLSDANNSQLNLVSASNQSSTGCLTIVFNSNSDNQNTGWEANISCLDVCPEINFNIIDVSPASLNGNAYELCFGDQITFETDIQIVGGDPNLLSIDWDFGNGDTATGELVATTFNEAGFYDVAISANYPGCETETYFMEVRVSDTPEINLSADLQQICSGDQVTLNAEVFTTAVTRNCGEPFEEVTYIEDLNSFNFPTLVECFAPNQSISNPNDIVNVCVTLEHSFLGDIDISLIAPDGTEIFLFQGSAFNGIETWAGEPVVLDNGSEGIGYQYCFNLNAQDLLVNGATTPLPNPLPDDPSNTTPTILPGDYIPVDSFDNLIGVPLNGEWNLNISDNVQFDDGFIFEWNLEFDNSIVPSENIFEPSIIKQEWIGFEGQGSEIIFSSITAGTYCFDYEVIDNFGCIFTETICVQVLPLPDINGVEDIYECTSDPSTPTIFNLTENNTNIFGPQDPNDFILSYHFTLQGAELGVNPILDPTAYLAPQTPATIYVRLEFIETGCISNASFQLFDSGFIENMSPLEQCSVSGQEVFDLTEKYPEILSPGQDLINSTVSFHNTEDDAVIGINEINDISNYVNSSSVETIWVRVENNTDNNCIDIGSFELIAHNKPNISIPPQNLSQCTSNIQNFNLTLNDAFSMGIPASINSGVTYHLTQEDANNDLNPISSPLNYTTVNSFETIWVRVENLEFSGCFDVSSFDLVVVDSEPVNLSPPPLIECDDDNDGFYNLFDLTTKDDQISLNNPLISVTYHLTEEDANNNIGQLSSPYSNIVENSQTIYYRAVDTTTGCVQVSSFEIQVIDSPLLNTINEPLIGCDDDNDEKIVFDLTQVESQLLGNDLNPNDLEINYFTSLTGAQNNLNPIGQPSSFLNTSNPQTIWVRVDDISNNNGCFDIKTIELQVSPLPDFVFAEPFNVCDDEAGGSLDDEIAFFDLNEVISEITQVNNELLVEFFESSQDLVNDIPIDTIENYQNSSNPQTVYVKITSSTTGCVGESSFTIFVRPTPSLAIELEPVEICDADNDGFEEFDLASLVPDILNNEPEVTITFHLSQAAADLGVNAIDTSLAFGIINPNQQTLFVRAENTGPNGDDGSGCYVTRPLELIVLPSPEIQGLEDLSICDDEIANGFSSFDLTQNTALILGDQNATEIDITYHESQNDAETGINPIAVPSNYTNLTNPQTIYVRIENEETGCYDLYNSSNDVNNTFTLTVEPLPEANPPTDLQICDDNYDNDPFPQNVFDLTVKEAEIAGVTIVPDNLEFSYFETQSDLDNGINQIENPSSYTNLSQPQDIFVKVTDTSTENLCFNSTIITISVLPLPSPSETDPDILRLEACDDNNDGIAATTFDLTASGVLISENENVILTYYTSESGAMFEDSEDLITDPTSYINEPSLNLTDENGQPTNTQVIYVRIDNNVNTNFCYVIVPIEIVVRKAPQINLEGNPFAYTLCEDDISAPGFATIFSTSDIADNLWDITDGSSSEIIPLLDPNTTPAQNLDDFEVSYHETIQDAENGVNPISPGYLASDGQIFYIRVTDVETGCYNANFIGMLQIIIEPRPGIANENPEDIEICADDIDNSSIGSVDLTIQDEFINTNALNNTSVLYYASLMDYNNGSSILNPTNFQTSETPQTIFAEVVDDNTLCESSNVVNFDIIVRPIPDLDLPDGDLLVCFDENDNLIDNDISPPNLETGLSSDNYTFEWTLDDIILSNTTSSYTATLPGAYNVTATNIFTGCQTSDTVNVIESLAPSFDLAIVTPAFSENSVIEVTIFGDTGNYEFQLNDGDWISLIPGQTTLILNTQNFGTQTIRARDNSGCGIVEKTITVIDYPDFFTPNEDGINDTWNIDLDQPGSSIHIFDRYGKNLKQIKPGGEGWDGTFNGKPMPPQSYWFRIDYVEPLTGRPNSFKSHFILKR
jgi:gliding motility-associated-like protein